MQKGQWKMGLLAWAIPIKGSTRYINKNSGMPSA